MRKTRTISATLLFLLAAIMAFALWAVFAYQRDMQAARARLAATGTIIETACGPISYGERGSGPPILVIHGAGGGYDQGLLLGEMLVGDGYRRIAPSRFGYLGALPEDVSLRAQAEAFACLLDELEIDRAAIVGVSAGGPPGIEFARIHPERASALILASAVSFIDDEEASDDDRISGINRIIANDFVYWALSKFTWRRMGALFGAPNEAQRNLTSEELNILRTVLEQMSPLSRRLAGISNDQTLELPRDYPLGDISRPTLVIHAEDDTLVPPVHAAYSADGIPGAALILVSKGGHFLIGQHDQLRAAVRNWLGENGSPPDVSN